MQLARIGSRISLIAVPTIAIGAITIATSMAKSVRLKHIIVSSQDFKRELK